MPATVIHGECLAEMRRMAEEGVRVQAIVTDPPYHLTTGKKGGTGLASLNPNSPAGRARVSTGFMGRAWDGGDIAMQPKTWRLAHDLLPPGGHLLAFGGTRTFHRMACAIEDAGFEIRDTLMWVYGTGFPKSHDVGKAIDREAGAAREVVGRHIQSGQARKLGNALEGSKDGSLAWQYDITAHATEAAKKWSGWGTALKPGYEPIILARKPLAGTVAENVLAHGTGALNVDACRAETADNLNGGAYAGSTRTDGLSGSMAGALANAIGRDFVQPVGRWPANLVTSGDAEVEAAFAAFGGRRSYCANPETAAKASGKRFGAGTNAGREVYGTFATGFERGAMYADTGSASRFFAKCPPTEDELRFHYSAKASRQDRAGSRHPTVKPQSLMRWLCRLITPPAGTVLDPFAGSGSTLQAALSEGFDAIGIEQEAEYYQDCLNRISAFEAKRTPAASDADMPPLLAAMVE